jgi:hypothetical protein
MSTHAEDKVAMKRCFVEYNEMSPIWFVYVEMPDGKALRLSPADCVKLAEESYRKRKKAS